MKRIVTAVILIAAVVALVLSGQLWMIALFAAVVAGLAAYEYRDACALQKSVYIPLWWLLGATAIIFFSTVKLPEMVAPGIDAGHVYPARRGPASVRRWTGFCWIPR